MKRFTLLALIIVTFTSNGYPQPLRKYNLFLRSNIGLDTLWDGAIIRIFGIASRLSSEPTLPAKTLYCNEGDSLVLNCLSISQGDHHTIHLHGMDADTRNDGDPATSFELSHMQDTTYSVIALHAGTYIYHCHVTDVIHVQMGMYGLIIVRSKDSSQTTWTGGMHYDKTVAWLTSEIDRKWHDTIPQHDLVADTIHVPPYHPGYFLINGKSESQLASDTLTRIDAVRGNQIYVRAANIGFFYNRMIFPSWLHARKIDSDGRPLDNAIQNDTVEIAPGERYGVMLDATENRSDEITMEFVNMNTDSVWSRQHISVNIVNASVRLKDDGVNSLVVNPNPGNNTITLSMKNPEEVYGAIRLYNILGKIVFQTQAILPLQMDLHSLPGGTYTVLVTTKEGILHGSVVIVR